MLAFLFGYSLGLWLTAGVLGYLLRGVPYAKHWKPITWALAVWPVTLVLSIGWCVLRETRTERLK